MTIRDHAIFFWGLVKRWPRGTAVALGGLAVLYFLYYAGVEVFTLVDSALAAAGMVLMALALKTALQFVFYRFFFRNEFDGSFLILGVMASLLLIAALAISIVVADRQFAGPLPAVPPVILVAFAVVFSLALGGAARLFYWVGGGGLRRR